MLFAEVTQDWTALGLLAVVLTSMGVFLKWYLPHRDEKFDTMMTADRATWVAQLTKEQDRSERIIGGMATTFREAVSEFKAATAANTHAIGDVRDCLRELQEEIQNAKWLAAGAKKEEHQ